MRVTQPIFDDAAGLRGSEWVFADGRVRHQGESNDQRPKLHALPRHDIPACFNGHVSQAGLDRDIFTPAFFCFTFLEDF